MQQFLSGNGNHFTISGTLTHNSNGYFDFGGGHIYNNVAMPTISNDCTCVFWIKTTDTQSLFWSLYNNTTKFLGAYRVGNKYYNSSVGTPTYFQDTVSKANIYDNLIDGNWHMVEFKGVDFSTWTSLAFSQYTSFIFDTGSIAAIWIYNRTLTSIESQQNFNALRGRFGI